MAGKARKGSSDGKGGDKVGDGRGMAQPAEDKHMNRMCKNMILGGWEMISSICLIAHLTQLEASKQPAEEIIGWSKMNMGSTATETVLNNKPLRRSVSRTSPYL